MSLPRNIEDYVIVTVITLLIWLYAESRTLEPYDPGRLALELRTPSEDMVVSDASATAVHVQFTGAKSAISRLQARLSGKLRVTLPPLEPGKQTLPLQDLLPKSEQLGDASVNIASIDPPTLTLTLTRRVPRYGELIWKPEGVRLQDGFKAEPSKVRITLPEDKLSDVMIDGKVVLELRSREDIQSFQPNKERKVQADVLLPPSLANNPNVRVEPAEVTLSFIIEKKEERYTPPSVPVFITWPPGEPKSFTVELNEEDQLLKDVKVTGPADLVAQVRSGTIPIRAQVVFDHDALVKGGQRGESPYPIQFVDVPTALSVESPKTSVRVTIKRLGE